MASPVPNADPKMVQGDILYAKIATRLRHMLTILRVGVPKKVEIYYFFRIDKARVTDFRKHLAAFVPKVATTSQLIAKRKELEEWKKTHTGLFRVYGITISFSHTGLAVVSSLSPIHPKT